MDGDVSKHANGVVQYVYDPDSSTLLSHDARSTPGLVHIFPHLPAISDRVLFYLK